MLKKIAIILSIAILLIASANITGAKDVSIELTFGWTQPEADLPNLLEWRLKWAAAAEGSYIPIIGTDGNPITIAYDGSPKPEYIATQNFIVAVNAGESVTYYFKLSAVNKSGEESDLSGVALNEDGTTGVIFSAPWDPVGVPIQFKVKAKVITTD